MHWLQCSLLATTLCAAYWQDAVAQTELPSTAKDTKFILDPKENERSFQHTDTVAFEFGSTEKFFQGLTTNSNQEMPDAKNFTGKLNTDNVTASKTHVEISLKSGSKREVENVTFNDIKPFLLFPILPFLFPPKEEESLNSGKDEFSIPKNETSKVDGNSASVKPFIFFDFAFIRQIPLNNRTKKSNDSKIINVKKLNISKADDSKRSSHKIRRRWNTNTKMETPGFFDDSPLFPDTELDEFLPKPDLFFPDLFFHHKPLRKLSRRKRDQKKPDLKSDLKFFFDAFDEAFMRTKRELERTDPILNFLRGGERALDDGKKEEDELFSQFPSIQEKPRVKLRIQRNIKRLNSDRRDNLPKAQDSPMIIVDKVVKIGEFHVHDNGRDKDKSKRKKKRDANNSKRKSLGVDISQDEIIPNEKDETFSSNIFELIKQEESKRKKRHHAANPEGQTYTKIQSKEIRILPQTDTSIFSVGSNASIELKKRENETEFTNISNSDKATEYENLMKIIDSLNRKIKTELTNVAERLKRKGSSYYENVNSKKASYYGLKKNTTELLNQFLELAKNLDDAKLVERLEVSEHGDTGVFDWTEKETLQNTNILGKDVKGKRQKKDLDFEDEYVDTGKKERQVADLNYLFLTVTLPTVFVFALALLVCFFSLQVKGKICSRLFRPRQVFIVEEERPTQFKSPTGTKNGPKVQSI